jgi:hypothetical protein
VLEARVVVVQVAIVMVAVEPPEPRTQVAAVVVALTPDRELAALVAAA